jgi:hypothetical protein
MSSAKAGRYFSDGRYCQYLKRNLLLYPDHQKNSGSDCPEHDGPRPAKVELEIDNIARPGAG